MILRMNYKGDPETPDWSKANYPRLQENQKHVLKQSIEGGNITTFRPVYL